MLTPDSHSQLYSYLALASVPGMSPAKWLALMSELSITASNLVARNFQGIDAPLCKTLNTLLDNIDQRKVENAMTWLEQSPLHHIICYESKHFPTMLKQLTSPPLVLFISGNINALSENYVAIVGSRRASHNGLELAERMACQLSQTGVGIISGLAAGIDAAAHRGALKGNGATVAIVGTGPDNIYPRRNQYLHGQIIDGHGAIVSEFWPGTPPRAQHFPRRNRIIAAMSHGTLVVEATIKSGTLITANMAANLGRDVFAIPGCIDNPLTQGCHHLLKQGAILVTNVQDILVELDFPVQKVQPGEDVAVKSEQKTHGESLATDKILASVNHDVTSVDIICERSNLPVSQVLATLLQYELRGLVTTVPGGYVKLRGK